MADVVRGKFCILYMKLGSVYYPIACTQTVEITTDVEMLELAPRTAGDFPDFEYGKFSGQISGTGLAKIVTSPDNLYTIFDIFGYQWSKQKVLVKYVIEDPQGNLKVFECLCLIRSVGLSKGASTLLAQSFNLLMSGRPVLTTTPVANENPQILILEYTALGGETSLDASDTFGSSVTVLVFYLNGLSKTVKIAPIGYTSDQVQYNESTKTFIWITPLTAGDYIKILYIDTDSVPIPPEPLPTSARDIGDGDARIDGAGEYRVYG